MARGTVVQVTGIAEVVRELRRRGMDGMAAIETICHAGATPIRQEAQSRAPGSFGDRLDQMTTTRTAKRVVVSIGPVRDKHIARFLEFGTAPHKITARRAGNSRRRGKKALVVPGYGVFRSVRHPGATKRPFMRPAYVQKKGEAQDEMRKATKRAMRL